MKNFQDYRAAKYAGEGFAEVEPGIYRTVNPYGDGEVFVTSLSFEMEQDSYGEEGGSPRNICQVPFEDILDEFCTFVSDFYDELNEGSERTCYQEFASTDAEDIVRLRGIIGKRVYAEPYVQDGEEYYKMVIE